MTRPRGQRDRSYAPRGMRLPAAADYLGFGQTKFLELVDDGRMPPGKLVDGCRVWDRFQLDDAFDALPDDNGTQPPTKTGWAAVV